MLQSLVNEKKLNHTSNHVLQQESGTWHENFCSPGQAKRWFCVQSLRLFSPQHLSCQIQVKPSYKCTANDAFVKLMLVQLMQGIQMSNMQEIQFCPGTLGEHRLTIQQCLTYSKNPLRHTFTLRNEGKSHSVTVVMILKYAKHDNKLTLQGHEASISVAFSWHRFWRCHTNFIFVVCSTFLPFSHQFLYLFTVLFDSFTKCFASLSTYCTTRDHNQSFKLLILRLYQMSNWQCEIKGISSYQSPVLWLAFVASAATNTLVNQSRLSTLTGYPTTDEVFTKSVNNMP